MTIAARRASKKAWSTARKNRARDNAARIGRIERQAVRIAEGLSERHGSLVAGGAVVLAVVLAGWVEGSVHLPL
jgi:hypothetical protein